MDQKIYNEEEKKLKDVLNLMQKEKDATEEELKHSDKKYDLENVAKAELRQQKINKIENIKKNINKPYFARMDFKENGRSKETFYLGKMSLIDTKTLIPIIIDWRAPISNLYYEGKLGKASYKCLDSTIEGDILLKRQYMIENKKLEKYVDINVTGNDALLQDALEEKADDRLKNIVATIQGEQNRIIRADINKPLIVQGVAGSGKTTIALHRIAYLIYNYEKEFKPEEFMIIAPTKFFLNYISNILPDLGVNDVKQYTFEEFAFDVIGKKLKISDNNEKLVMIVNRRFDEINEGNIDGMIKESKFKSSIEFKNLVEDYLKSQEEIYVPSEDFKFENTVILKKDNIKQLFKETYKMYDFELRLKEIEKNLISELKRKAPEIIKNIKDERSRRVYNLEGKERLKVFEEYEKKIDLIEKNYKKLTKNFLNSTKRKNSIEHYKNFIENFIPETNDTLKYLKKNTMWNLNNNEIAFEDLAPIMYLQIKIFGIKDNLKIKHVVIDEAQDYGEFQFDVLKSILGKVGKIDKENKGEFLSKGYMLSDLVGLSYLEKEYEDILKGSKGKYKLNKDGTYTKVLDEKIGNDIYLNIDMDIEEKLYEIMKKHIYETKGKFNTEFYNKTYVLVATPDGKIKAALGLRINPDNSFTDVTNDIITSSFVVGSVVKAASNTVAYNENVIIPGKKINDSCVKLYLNTIKCSFSRLGYIDDISALEKSSNYYQFINAIKVMGYNYKYNMKINATSEDFDKYRNKSI